MESWWFVQLDSVHEPATAERALLRVLGCWWERRARGAAGQHVRTSKPANAVLTELSPITGFS